MLATCVLYSEVIKLKHQVTLLIIFAFRYLDQLFKSWIDKQMGMLKWKRSDKNYNILDVYWDFMLHKYPT